MKFDDHLRKSQLIVPFGPGAIYTLTDGVNCIVSGLDDWFKEWCPKKKNFSDTQLSYTDLSERGVIIEDDRLTKHLNIGHIYSVPSKEFELSADENWERKLRIPFFVFPAWWYCRNCGHMVRKEGSPPNKCDHIPSSKAISHTTSKQCSSYSFVQVPFALACENGHLSDFPWVEWLHRTAKIPQTPKCRESLVYRTKDGGNALDHIIISCEHCGCQSSLKGIMTNNPVLQTFPCNGGKAWSPYSKNTPCDVHPKAIMTNAGNVYYADVKSSLYIQSQTKKLATIVHKINSLPQELLVKHKDFLDEDPSYVLKHLGNKNSVSFDESSTDITEAYRQWLSSSSLQEHSTEWSNNIKKDEWDTLIRMKNNKELVIRQQNLRNDFIVKYGINQLFAIDKVRETRVLAGFSRITSRSFSQQGNQEILWSNMPSNIKDRWLPGVKIYGEGIFFTFEEERLQKWENKDAVINRIKKIQNHYDHIRARQQEQGKQPWAEKEISPRLVLLHTLSHLVIKQLAFYCGYNTASMRERLYSDNSQDSPMAGILIYTASGDSEGTLGGLVSMSNPDSFNMIIENALNEAFWCSSDPVCSEQEPSLTGRFNLAACHSCCLLPETSCEEFNSYLDRALWVPLVPYSFL